MGDYFLIDNPPRTSQFEVNRERPPSGVVVLHTAENQPDFDGDDSKAEAVASWIQRRTDHGCYHSIVDSDSTVRMMPYSYKAYHVKGHNISTLGLSFACRTIDWDVVPDWWVDGAMRQAGMEARRMSDWLLDEYQFSVPAVKISRREYDEGRKGFLGHSDLDPPPRRFDPGEGFDWERFLDAYKDSAGMSCQQQLDIIRAVVNNSYREGV